MGTQAQNRAVLITDQDEKGRLLGKVESQQYGPLERAGIVVLCLIEQEYWNDVRVRLEAFETIKVGAALIFEAFCPAFAKAPTSDAIRRLGNADRKVNFGSSERSRRPAERIATPFSPRSMTLRSAALWLSSAVARSSVRCGRVRLGFAEGTLAPQAGGLCEAAFSDHNEGLQLTIECRFEGSAHRRIAVLTRFVAKGIERS
jgi:hypothetical protein